MDNNTHTHEIYRSRVGGFGSSDADMFYKIATKGIDSLSQTDRRRIAVAKGIIPYTPIPQTPAMKAGHDFEDWLFTGNYKCMEREVLLLNKIVEHFDTFSHVDFYDIGTGYVTEAKYSQKSISDVKSKYYAQFQWHYLMGAKIVSLIHGQGHIEPLMPTAIHEVYIERDDAFIEILKEGIYILDRNWDNLDLTLRDEITPADLLPYDKEGVELMTAHLAEIKRLKAEIADYEQRLLLLFEDNGIKSLKSDNYTISYVGPSVRRTFDKEALKNAHPEIDLSQFEKESKVKSSLKITLK